MAEKKEKLFDMFPECSYEEWRAKVEADLKGADFNKKLVWRTNEGFNVEPVYRAENIADFKTVDTLPGEYPYVRGTRTDNDWLIRQEVLADTPAEANAIAKEIITKGITSLGFNVALESEADVKALLDGIDIKKFELNFKCCPRKAVSLAKVLVDYLRNNGLLNDFHGSIDFNPMRRALKHGTEFPGDIKALSLELLDVVKIVPELRVFAVDSFMFCDAGAYIFQELGYALAWGAEWLSMLTDAGVKADDVARRIKFNMGVSSNYFMEIAKFRAARMVWAQIVEQYKPESKLSSKMLCHAVTSRFNQTIYDAHVNLLRSQTETMSAALAGVDSITTVPFDVPYKKPDAFSERIARNQQFLLKEESHLDKVVDPAGGSYYVETLTVSLAKEAWKLFLDVEEKGGFLACINDNSIQDAVNATAEKRHVDVARRKEILLGTNQYPNINETAAQKIETTGCSCGCHHGEGESENKGLSSKRAASDFEALRLATEASSHRPKVFMLTIGNLAMRLARAQFSTNFFGCAGYEIIDNLGFNTVEEGVDAALEKNADVIVLCSSDDEYAALAPEAYKYLDGRAMFVVAGAPACMDDLKAVGINDFIHVRCNVLETLQSFNAKLLK
ncbi:methylmalonyl-CoA mutase small subunit [Barnesiella sp. WM24]|uniref:methylmalonyl-CoA mutase small subunit n=1 Tax=Barnesiella sp. WM24 TaxID=2558278 RepID=UPI000B044238|nr:methylmalonyl-CoA mutase small subunit [Barnesiella sp. WM24]MDE6115114.1 methylmalonyl-CoA mutase small subunit [Muribaculum sp.]TFU92299.1 methylmalonyl-CoA mutase small subunit [Barnesiella sp. WM24]